ncbi:MAG: glycosyltransferase [Lachnospiraceae bacterium]|jgi:glycosyltransferase involved in cell wall biosynthesis|nr:glycosyltransferase [Lachnospiraceae bacterium]
MKKKILFIIWSYTYGGGAEALLTLIVNHLNPDKYDISIIEYEHADIKTEAVGGHVHILPPIEKVDVPEKTTKGYQVYHTPELLIQQYIEREYDLYVSFNYQIPTFLLPSGTKNISWIHGAVYDLGTEEAKREWTLQDQAFDKAVKIVAISDFTEKSLIDLFPRHKEKVIKIYNGIDVNSVRRKAQQDAVVKLCPKAIVSVARLDENKNPLRLLRIFKSVHDIVQDAQLYYIGEGKLRKELEKEITELKLEKAVHLLGYIANPYPVLGQASVFCLMSETEGFPISIMESLALNVPFISTNVGGSAELADHGRCGKIINTDREAVSAVLDMLEAGKDKMKAACQNSIERFAHGPYIKRIEALFDSVMEEKEGVSCLNI